jgi:ribosome-binding factor A
MQFQRKDRVGDSIKKEVSRMIQQELKDPGIGFVTITDVDVSPDLKRARIYYSILGDEESKTKTARALHRASGFVQHEIGKRLRLKHIPEVEFRFDGSVEYGARIEKLIQKIHRQDEAGGEEIDLSEEEKE